MYNYWMGWEEERKEGERVINKTSVTQRIKIISIKTYLISVRNELNATFKCTCQTVATLHTQTFINMQRSGCDLVRLHGFRMKAFTCI